MGRVAERLGERLLAPPEVRKALSGYSQPTDRSVGVQIDSANAWL
jgi:hypothetical protein